MPTCRSREKDTQPERKPRATVKRLYNPRQTLRSSSLVLGTACPRLQMPSSELRLTTPRRSDEEGKCGNPGGKENDWVGFYLNPARNLFGMLSCPGAAPVSAPCSPEGAAVGHRGAVSTVQVGSGSQTCPFLPIQMELSVAATACY